MASVFKLPAVGDTMLEGEIVEWLIGVGDEVELDQAICSIETDKSVVEMTTPHRGTVLALGGEPGDVIAVGETLIVVGEPGEELPRSAEPAGDAQPTEPAGDSQPTEPVGDSSAGENPAVASIPAAAASPPGVVKALPGVVKALPRVCKLARERGVDLASVTGTGPGGSVTESDLDAVAGAGLGGGDRRERLSAMRRSIARHMSESAQLIPQFTSMVEADATGLLATRSAAVERTDARVPLDALLVALTVTVLRDHPIMNAMLDGDEVVYFGRYDIGVAVDTAGGLMAPVVRGADALTVEELSSEVLRLAGAARNRSLLPDEFVGATATVNNVGALGVLAGTPLLPLGTSMIAAFGMVRPVVRLTGAVAVETPIMTISATFDHRLIDGGAAGRFLADLKDRIESATPRLLA